MVETACRTHLRMDFTKAMQKRLGVEPKVTDEIMRDLLFGNYMEPDADPKIYDEVDSFPKLEKLMAYYLKEFNANSNAPMDLVLFRFAIEHISR